jgi:hypothetical protein
MAMETIAAEPGEHIETFLQRMIEHTNANNAEVMAVHNDSTVVVEPGSNVRDLFDAWDLAYGK